MVFHFVTIFPEIFNSYINEGMIARAIKSKRIKVKVHDLRKWTKDKHKTVDDTPYGGGAGMLLKVEPIYKAIKALELRIKNKELTLRLRSGQGKNKKIKTKVILLSAKGKTWEQGSAQKYSKLDEIIFICPRYEGIDERVLKFVDDEISIGDYVLTGGELGAMVIMDSIARLIPGVLGNKESALDESHSKKGELEYPQYTRPEVFTINKKKHKVPKVLLSGNHSEINNWREKEKKKK